MAELKSCDNCTHRVVCKVRTPNMVLCIHFAADVVEVVRCKDCKHYGWEQDHCHGKTERFCRQHKGLVCVTKDSFCSYGEKREETV